VTSKQISQQLREDGLVAIIRGNFSVAEQCGMAEVLLEGGVRVLEITLNSKDALESLSQLNAAFSGDLLLGAGTVLSADDAQRALAAGARFLITPNLDLGAVAVARDQDTLIVPGVFTATKAQTAHRAGCRLVKRSPR